MDSGEGGILGSYHLLRGVLLNVRLNGIPDSTRVKNEGTNLVELRQIRKKYLVHQRTVIRPEQVPVQ